MNVRTVEKASDYLLTLTIFLVPVIIWRIAVDPIDLVKGTFLWILTAPLAALTVVRLAAKERLKAPKKVVGAFAGLALASLVATVTSMAPLVSVFGQYQRYTGLLTILSGLLVASLVCDASAREHTNLIVGGIVAASIMVLGYGMIQEFGLDPLEWSASSFGKLVFSTLGNPNTASAWLSCVVPVLFGLWINSKNIYIRIFLSLLLGLSSPMLGAFLTFQGQIAVLFVAFVLVIGWRSENRTLWRNLGESLACAGIVVIPQLPSRHALFLLGPAVVLSGLAITQINTSPEFPKERRSLGRRRAAGLLGTAIGLAAVGIVAFRDTLSSGLRGGFLERGDFFRAAWGVWKSHPIFGTGLESFGFVYGEFRPESHAVNLESSRTSSVHNIFLGMFSNGGLILGIAYLIVTFLVGVYAYRLMRLGNFRSVTDAGIVGSWLAFQVVSLVSVEHVALFTLNFTLCGLIIGRAVNFESRVASSSGPRRKAARGRRSGKTVKSAAVAPVAVLVVVLVLLGWWQFSRPLRAANSAYQGLQAYYSRSDLEFAVEGLERASRLAPWEALYKLQHAEALAQQGDYATAAPIASRAAAQAFYQGGIVSSLASIVFDSGDISRGIEIMEKAVEADPFAPNLKLNLATIKALGAQQYVSRGDTGSARKELGEALAIEPDLEIEGLAELRSSLGV